MRICGVSWNHTYIFVRITLKNQFENETTKGTTDGTRNIPRVDKQHLFLAKYNVTNLSYEHLECPLHRNDKAFKEIAAVFIACLGQSMGLESAVIQCDVDLVSVIEGNKIEKSQRKGGTGFVGISKVIFIDCLKSLDLPGTVSRHWTIDVCLRPIRSQMR
jgi:hypothetical protein